MWQERRRTQRQVVNSTARIQSHVGSPVHACLVTDASDGGIRLFADGIDLPDEFILVFDGTGQAGRNAGSCGDWMTKSAPSSSRRANRLARYAMS